MEFKENSNCIRIPIAREPIIYFLLDGNEVVYIGQSKLGLFRHIAIQINTLLRFLLLNVNLKTWIHWKFFILENICQNTTKKLLMINMSFLLEK